MQNTEAYPKLRYLVLFLWLLVVESVIVIATRGTNLPLLTAFIPSILGGAAGALTLGFLLSLLAKKEKRFVACVILSLAMRALSLLGQMRMGD